MDVEQYLEDLDDLSVGVGTLPQLEALTVASDSLAFCKSLFDRFQENGTLKPDVEFDLGYMENLIDALVGELFAAVAYLKDHPSHREAVQDLRVLSSNIKIHNSTAKQEDRIPFELEAGCIRLATRIEASLNGPVSAENA